MGFNRAPGSVDEDSLVIKRSTIVFPPLSGCWCTVLTTNSASDDVMQIGTLWRRSQTGEKKAGRNIGRKAKVLWNSIFKGHRGNLCGSGRKVQLGRSSGHHFNIRWLMDLHSRQLVE